MNNNSLIEIPLAEVNRGEHVASHGSNPSEEGGTSPNSSMPEFSLAPVDGGKDAWLCLLGCFFIEAMVWAFPFAFGVFQNHYTSENIFGADGNSGIAVVGTCALGVMYMGSPFSLLLLQRWPSFRRKSTYLGLIICTAGLVASSFTTRVWQVILTQGVMYGVGGGLLYHPLMVFIDEWFVRRKGLAFGVMWAGTGFSGVTVPFIVTWGLSRFSFRIVVRAWAVIMLMVAGPLLYFVKPRVPASAVTRTRRFDFHFVLSNSFIFLELGNILQGLGYFVPSIYLPTYARSLGLENAAASAPVALLNAGSVFGCVLVGTMVDRLHVTNVIIMSTLGASFAVFVLWGLSISTPLLFIFSLIYGFFAGSFSSTWPGVMQEVKKKDNTAESNLVMGLLVAGRGIGSVACGPMSEVFLKGNPWRGTAGLGYGTGYGVLIVFTGVTAMLGGMGFGAKKLKLI